MSKIRIQFSKTGNSVYISHLDLLRTFSRTIRRSGLKAAYSQGFNPHLLIAFSMPLSLGTSSLCEFADIQFEEDEPYDTIKQKLNDSLAESIRVLNVFPATEPLTLIASSDYSIVFEGNTDMENLRVQGEKLLCGVDLVVEKKSKRFIKEVDILPFILQHEWNLQDNALSLNVRVLTSGEMTLNSNTLVKALERYIPQFQSLSKSITKMAVYTKEGNPFPA